MSAKSLSRALDRLSKQIPKQIAVDKPLAKYTTLRVGGPAAIFATVDTISQLRSVMQTITDYELPALILGRGSNLLISDEGWPGVVFQLGRDFSNVVVENDEIRAGGATTLTSLVQSAVKHHLAGLAFAVGIPGTVGAAVAVNAGANGSDMGCIVKKITYYTRSCELRTAGREHLSFSYRNCRLPAGAVVLEACLGMSSAAEEVIKTQMETYWRRRKSAQPLDLPNAGSVFKNPNNDFAGRLIEAAGFKGQRIGGALVSPKHANFFVNTGEATAADFHQLVTMVAAGVRDLFGVELEPEIKLIGDWAYAAR